jgi:hypothetical protein
VEHEYLTLYANANDPIWTDPFDPNPGTPHPCAQDSKAPDRIIWIVFEPSNLTEYNDYTNLNDPTVVANWVTALKAGLTTLVAKYPAVKRIEIMTFPRGPGDAGPGTDCEPAATTDHEDVVEPWVDNAIAEVAADQPTLVFAAPKFYVGNCDWFANGGPHFLDGGQPGLVAQMFAAYYKLND